MFTDMAQSDYYQDDSAVDAARDKLRWVATCVAPGGRLLDVGANVGIFAREAAASYDALGIEPGRRTVEWGRMHLGAPLEVGTIDQSRADFRGRFNAITLFDVIEHLAEPRRALEQCRDYLAPGGHLFITTPDSGSVMARLLGSQWYYIDMLEHVSLFNRTNLGRLLRETGLAPVAFRTIGRQYRLSYIERRLRELSRDTPMLSVAHLLALPLRWASEGRVRLNLGDVMGVTIKRAEDQ
ncbi:MAG: class I SAM-dependent methyltransferase [Vicinamibacterales bacterium]